jgi:hypothetical protein
MLLSESDCFNASIDCVSIEDKPNEARSFQRAGLLGSKGLMAVRYDTVIIGAGMSGLSAGVRLAYYEKNVLHS